MTINSKKMNAEKIGQCIAKRRLAANLTQDQVAEKLGIGYEAVSRMERGKSIPTVIRLFGYLHSEVGNQIG